jgi:RyR domain
MAYQPVPLDHSHIQLSDELTQLIDRLGRNNHELWAKQRMEEGWVLGPQRDDNKKETPMLVPYDQLPESEKEYDRIMAVETLKTILALGYKIQPPGKELPK